MGLISSILLVVLSFGMNISREIPHMDGLIRFKVMKFIKINMASLSSPIRRMGMYYVCVKIIECILYIVDTADLNRML